MQKTDKTIAFSAPRKFDQKTFTFRLANMIIIRNLRGKTGKDAWVQVMATHAGSAWK